MNETTVTTPNELDPRPLFEWRSCYWSFLLKLAPEQPSPTIQAQPGLLDS
jgi:hypothetical protein